MLNNTEFKTIIDVVTRFPNEKACHEYLASRRWSDGVISCPHEGCSSERAYVFKDGIRYKCCECKKQFTAKTGTFMEASNISTMKWFVAIYLFLHKKGVSSIQLAKDVGITQKSAWFVLHRLRLALGNEEHEQLEGVVEIDETFVGGKARFKHKRKRLKHNPGRGWRDKTPVLGMLQRGGKFKAFVVPDVLMLTLKKTVYKHVKGGSDLMGDGFTGYRSLERIYNVQCVDHGRGHYVDGDVHTNTIEGAWSQFKKGICSTYHKTTPKHLQGYVNEFAFRYNYRGLSSQSQLDNVIKNMKCRLKYKDLIAA
ncbi:IS1595 family transposase [Mucilaginibacter pedocola]|uniref:ISXO2-like transposase domain-containing protein n=1 Tax=Mucilaginibacter pedocola TaxID=1792845 RepID=A0A1S9PJ00_9SPHI|nr:IS1595 family transposase [Mucilaginibacter pedocola]OOQ60905.1 hypothetical protein BC343_23375 [Mucilaginibacter pedocola]